MMANEEVFLMKLFNRLVKRSQNSAEGYISGLEQL
jgi:hypothetical protein